MLEQGWCGMACGGGRVGGASSSSSSAAGVCVRMGRAGCTWLLTRVSLLRQSRREEKYTAHRRVLMEEATGESTRVIVSFGYKIFI